VSALAQILTISGERLRASNGCADLQPSGWLAPKGAESLCQLHRSRRPYHGDRPGQQKPFLPDVV